MAPSLRVRCGGRKKPWDHGAELEPRGSPTPVSPLPILTRLLPPLQGRPFQDGDDWVHAVRSAVRVGGQGPRQPETRIHVPRAQRVRATSSGGVVSDRRVDLRRRHDGVRDGDADAGRGGRPGVSRSPRFSRLLPRRWEARLLHAVSFGRRCPLLPRDGVDGSGGAAQETGRDKRDAASVESGHQNAVRQLPSPRVPPRHSERATRSFKKRTRHFHTSNPSPAFSTPRTTSAEQTRHPEVDPAEQNDSKEMRMSIFIGGERKEVFDERIETKTFGTGRKPKKKVGRESTSFPTKRRKG